MAVFLAQNLAPIMFLALVVVLLMGYPVAFSLGAVGLMFFVAGVELAPFSTCTEVSSVCKKVGDQVITLDWHLLQAMPLRIYEVMKNETLLAIPFFTFMGLILERSGMAEDLLDTVGQLFGTLRGGLAYAVILVGALLAATTGVVAASVISMGLISLPIMLRYGYDRRVASGTIAAAGTLAQIIPPSLVLIVLADQLGRSVDDMYKGALLPGVALAGLYAVYVLIVSMIWPAAAPGLPAREIGFRKDDGSRGLPSFFAVAAASALFGYAVVSRTSYASIDFTILAMAAGIAFALAIALSNRAIVMWRVSGFLSPLAERVTFVMVPPLLLIFLVLGTILIGVATPTEGGAMGAVGAMALAAVKRRIGADPSRFNWSIVQSAAEATVKLSAFVLFILIGARIFSLTFYGVNGHVWVEHLLTGLPGGMYGFLILVMIAVFLLAFFLDFFELAFILVPLLAPAAAAIFTAAPEAVAIAKEFGLAVTTVTGADGGAIERVADVTPFMIWFGVLLAVNMQTSFMHPPFGFALFYLRSVAPREPYQDKVTGRMMEPVTTGQIYWGAVPYVGIQLLMVALVMAMPGLVMTAITRPGAPAAITRTSPGTAGPGYETGGRFALPPTPPAIDGAPPRDATAPRAPTLDMRELPRF